MASELKDQIQQIVNQALQKLGKLKEFAAPDADPTTRQPTDRIYRDEPILQRASQLISDEHPARYRQLRRIAADPESRRHSSAWLFYKQGVFMAAFEDDFEYHGSFQRYYPTYQDMTILQQRGYFSWRTQVRRGNVRRTDLSFVFVYIYELLNLIGVEDARQGYDALRTFWTTYRRLDASIDPYMRRWMQDFVIYYGLDKELLGQVSPAGVTGAISVLLRPELRTDEELFDALCSLSTYRLEKSRLYKKEPDRLRLVTCRVFRALTVYYEKHRKHTLCEKLFGKPFAGPWQPFEPAVFYDRRKYTDYTYAVSELEQYRCRSGIWTCEKLYPAKDKSAVLGAMLKTVDSRLREKLGNCPPIQPGNTTKILQSIVDEQIDDLLAQESAAQKAAALAQAQAAAEAARKAEEAARVRLDLSKLQDIRVAAALTRDKLIVEEETEPPFAASPAAEKTTESPGGTLAPCTAADTAAPQPAAATDTGPTGPAAALNDDALALLRHLLYGSAFAPRPGVLPAVLADAINDVFFDEFGDTVIVFEGDTPALLEDYTEDLKGFVVP